MNWPAHRSSMNCRPPSKGVMTFSHPKTIKIIGLSPSRIFSGFESSFFNALRANHADIRHLEVEVPWFKWFCTATSFYPNKKKWGLRRDLAYHTSITAFKVKSAKARKLVRSASADADCVYQVGSLWNPLNASDNLPFFMQVDYTSLLSKRRNSEWKRKPGRQEEFWIEEEKRLYSLAAKVLTTTENARQSLLNDYGVAPEKVVTVGAGVSPPYDQIDMAKTPKYDSKRIFFVGKGFEGKGLDTILEAFPEVRRAVPDARLTIVGPTSLGVSAPGVDYLGRIADRSRVKEMYYEHAVFVMPSRFEPVGQVFLEAMSCRLPCIGSTIDAMPELIDHGSTGYVIEPGDAKTLARYLIEILSDPALAEAMGKAGARKLSEGYTWEVVGKRIAESIRNTL